MHHSTEPFQQCIKPNCDCLDVAEAKAGGGVKEYPCLMRGNSSPLHEMFSGGRQEITNDLHNMLNAQRDQLGPTGKHPEGKLTEADEGEIGFAVFEYEGKIVMNFNTPVYWFGMNKEQAKAVAESLLKHCK